VGFEILHQYVPGSLPKLSDIYQDSAGQKPLITDDTERQNLIDALDRNMNEDQIFLDSDLSLRKLADVLDTSSNKLSWLINEEKAVNFNDYINGYRLEYFKKLALKPSNQNLTLLGLALESGFNSKSTFNDYFKKKTGQTPRSWVKSQM